MTSLLLNKLINIKEAINEAQRDGEKDRVLALQIDEADINKQLEEERLQLIAAATEEDADPEEEEEKIQVFFPFCLFPALSLSLFVFYCPSGLCFCVHWDDPQWRTLNPILSGLKMTAQY